MKKSDELIIYEAKQYLLQEYTKDEIEKNLIFALFIEAVVQSDCKTWLYKNFIKSCNQEISKRILRNNAFYLELKDVIKGMNIWSIKIL